MVSGSNNCGFEAEETYVMDYLTRRSVAQSGAVGGWLGHIRYPCIGGIGLRVEDGCVARAEIAQAAHDLVLHIQLPEGAQIPAEHVETLLAATGIAPAELRERTKTFLRGLAARAA